MHGAFGRYGGAVLPDASEEGGGQGVTTIQGLAQGARFHPVQRAWIEKDVFQCGDCQSGQLMTAAALLAKNAKPSDAQIDEAMAGNICHCVTYDRMHEGVLHAALLASTGGAAKGGK